jgi:hypothetical protein
MRMHLGLAALAVYATACCDPYPIQTTELPAEPQLHQVSLQPGAHDHVTMTTTVHATAPVTHFAVSAAFDFDGKSCNFFTCPKVTLTITPQGNEPKGPNDDGTNDGNPDANASHDTGACAAPCDKTIAAVVDIGDADTSAIGGTLELQAIALYETAKPGFCEPAPPPPRGDTLTLVVN